MPDPVPAATLLVPYFEAGREPADRRSTFVEVVNTATRATTVGITLWTQWAIPTKTVQVTIGPGKVVRLDVRGLLHNGALPSRGCGGRINDRLSAGERSRLRRWHSGELDSRDRVASSPHIWGDGPPLPRGYITVDVHRRCAEGVKPSAPAYFGDGTDRVVGFGNVLVGSYYRTDSTGLIVESAPAVHIEASRTRFVTGDETFYGSLLEQSAADGREPLPNQYAIDLEATSVVADHSLTSWRDPGSAHVLAPILGQDVLPLGLPEWFTPNTGQGLRGRRTYTWDGQTEIEDDPIPPFACGLIGTACPPPAPTGLAAQNVPILLQPDRDPYDFGLQMPAPAARVVFDFFPAVDSVAIPVDPPRLQGWISASAVSKTGEMRTVLPTATRSSCSP